LIPIFGRNMNYGFAGSVQAGGVAERAASHVKPVFTVGYGLFGICKMLA
jgi:hypothetical protein